MTVTGYHPPSSTAVVDIPDAFADRYVEAGWTKADTEKKPGPRRRKADADDKK